jgi:hypothetical protein
MTEEQRLADNQIQRIRTQERRTEETAEARAEHLAKQRLVGQLVNLIKFK